MAGMAFSHPAQPQDRVSILWDGLEVPRDWARNIRICIDFVMNKYLFINLYQSWSGDAPRLSLCRTPVPHFDVIGGMYQLWRSYPACIRNHSILTGLNAQEQNLVSRNCVAMALLTCKVNLPLHSSPAPELIFRQRPAFSGSAMTPDCSNYHRTSPCSACSAELSGCCYCR
jgi:hypothetical protein